MDDGDKLLRLGAVQQAVGLGRTAIYDLVRAGSFPAPIQLTGRARAWRARDIASWVRDRPSAR